MTDTVRTAAVTAAGAVGGALAGGFISPIISGSPYAPALITGALGAGWLYMAGKRGKSWMDPAAGYGAIAAAGVLVIGAVALNAAKAAVAAKQATAGNLQMAGGWRAIDIQRLAPHTPLNITQPILAGNLGQTAMWASNHGYSGQQMRRMGLR